MIYIDHILKLYFNEYTFLISKDNNNQFKLYFFGYNFYIISKAEIILFLSRTKNHRLKQ